MTDRKKACSDDAGLFYWVVLIDRVATFASKPAPTRIDIATIFVLDAELMWERACSRRLRRDVSEKS
ncbi:hypothetical protein A1D17_19525 [Pseudomonas fluorescens]|uniref:Uncharacterized protein n=1 Tax=Pseudomonas fluorescens TaxID=294 RepID=A0A161Z4M6_PSEFL|nr:hypothetical protein A1D17_19525 [Pseudomonas fluorescens]